MSDIRYPQFYANLHDDWSLEVHREVFAGLPGALDRLYGPKIKAGQLDFTFYTVGGDDTIFTYDRDLLRGTLRSIDAARNELQQSSIFRLCLNATDVDDAVEGGRTAVMFTIEGAGPLDEDLSVLRTLYVLGLRSVILTWFKANAVADGVGEIRGGGLSMFGRQVIQEMSRLGMLVDVSQCTRQAVDDVLGIAGGPIIASHSNCDNLYPHKRNIPDAQLRGIADTGGLVGITSFPAHVSDRPTLDHFIDHVEHAVEVVGVDHVALGLNIVVHGDKNAVDFYERSEIEYSKLYLPELEDLPKFPVVAERLQRRGWAKNNISKIMGHNIRRVIKLLERSNVDV